MAKAAKPMALIKKNLTKEEIELRTEGEKKLKGNATKVYKVPTYCIKPVAEIYKVMVKELKAAEILNNLDIDLLVTTCNAIYQMREARKHIEKHGAIITTYEEGLVSKVVKNPAVNVEKDYQAIYHTGCIQLGLSPSARAKISILASDKKVGDGNEEKVF